MTPEEAKEMMSHDARLDAYHAKFGRQLRDEYIRFKLREAEKQVLIHTKCLVTETFGSLSSGREYTLPTDLLELDDLRYKDANDDADAKGHRVSLENNRDVL